MIVDIELMLTKIQTYVKANLNTAITAMNTEKNDSVVLKSISDSAYFLQGFNETVANFNPHLLLAVTDIVSQGIGPGTVKTIHFEVILIMEDRGQDLNIALRVFRYGRILEELFEKGFAKIIPSATFVVNSLVPIQVTRVNSNDPYRAVGVEIVASLG